MSVFHVQPIISAAAKYVFSFAKLLALARHPYVRGTGSYEMRGKPINRNGPLSSSLRSVRSDDVFHFVQPIISAAEKYVFSFAKLLALARQDAPVKCRWKRGWPASQS